LSTGLKYEPIQISNKKDNVQFQLKAAISEHNRQENFRFVVIYLKTTGPDASLLQHHQRFLKTPCFLTRLFLRHVNFQTFYLFFGSRNK